MSNPGFFTYMSMGVFPPPPPPLRGIITALLSPERYNEQPWLFYIHVYGSLFTYMSMGVCYVIERMVNAIACTVELWCTWEVCWALERLESHSAVASCDSYASFVLGSLPRVPWLSGARYGVYHLFSNVSILYCNVMCLPTPHLETSFCCVWLA